jgi:hypothetical protein
MLQAILLVLKQKNRFQDKSTKKSAWVNKYFIKNETKKYNYSENFLFNKQ